MSVDVDVVIVGGGPVGLASAIEVRLAGLTAVVIEPRENAIDKACGEGLMPGALPLLARLGVDPPGMPLRGVSYLTPSRRADHLFRTGVGRGVRRTALHDALSARAAELDVGRIVGRVETFTRDSSGITVNGVRAHWLFGADGLHSTVRKTAGLDHPRAGARRFGLRQHYAVAPWSDMIEVYWAENAEVYITPVADDAVGVAILGPQRTDFEATIRGIPALAARLDGAAPASSLRGAGPFRQRARRPSAGRVLLVGDASGYVDAITGEGLRLGLDQARLAVRHVTEGLDYDAAWARSTRDFRRLTSALVLAATSPLRGAIVPTAAAIPAAYGAVVERLAR